MNSKRKKIVVECCDGCPFTGQCGAWKAFTSKERADLVMNTDVGNGILDDCPLPDAKDGEVPYFRTRA
jgi:hypothetical protein